MNEIDYKVPNGKLLRLELAMDEDIISSIKISGDFFVHPEKAIMEIEGLLTGKRVDEVENVVNAFIAKNNIELIGFEASDLVKALRRVFR